MGNQLKAGTDGGEQITNSTVYNNCNAMSFAIPGTPTGYNSSLTEFCRAGDEAIILALNPSSTGTLAGNTIYGIRYGSTVNSYGDLGGIVCSTAPCDNSTKITYVDNILVGFDPLATGTMPAQYYLEDPGTCSPQVCFPTNPFTNTGSIYRNNLHYSLSTTCPDTGETNTLCTSPGVANVTLPNYGYVSVVPTAGSNILGVGYNLAGLIYDYLGNTRNSPTSIGAYDSTFTVLPGTFTGNLKGGIWY
jgi:hypothetical protein